MDDQDVVLACFPRARATEEVAVYQHGRSSPVMPGYWAIHPDDDLDSAELGQGRTEELAWKNAARKMGSPAAFAS
jgi:hypothetical protein